MEMYKYDSYLHLMYVAGHFLWYVWFLAKQLCMVAHSTRVLVIKDYIITISTLINSETLRPEICYGQCYWPNGVK